MNVRRDPVAVASADDRVRGLLDGGLVALIVASVAAAVLETDPALAASYGGSFGAIELVAGIVFTVELFVRAWASVENGHRLGLHPLAAALRYLLSPLGLVDVMTALPLWLAPLGWVPPELIWLLRTARMLKLLRYSSAFEIFGAVIYSERRPLLSAMVIMGTLLVLVSSLIYLVERDAQPDRFGTVPDAMWWGIVTLATVGYGDVVPITKTGRLIGAVAVVLGMGMFALPAGILASGFVNEMRRRGFVVTWNLVANVPFFENLPARLIAEIAAVLQPRVAAAGEKVVEVGAPGDRMFFIVSGEVEVQVPPRPVRLHPGDFFGEIALLTSAPRTATVLAATPCNLLVLRASDFRRLVAAHPLLREAIERVAAERLADNAAPIAPDGAAPSPG